MIQLLVTPLFVLNGKTTLNKVKAWEVIKFAVGFTVLVAMSVHWDAFNEFGAQNLVALKEDSGISIINGRPPKFFSGWHLVAYCFAIMPTVEGTVKKCIFRFAGTLVGGLSAYLLIWSVGDNDIGSIIWLTATAGVSIFFTLEKTPLALLGPSKDYGYGGFYIVLTQTVIVMEHMAGIGGTWNQLVANRIFSNVTGIAMAVFVAMIPPAVKGSDPVWERKMLNVTQLTFERLVAILPFGIVEEIRELRQSYPKEHDVLRNEADALLTDARRGSAIPIYKVDETLVFELQQLTITSSIIVEVLDRATFILENNPDAFQDPESLTIKQQGKEGGLVRLTGEPKDDLLLMLQLLACRIKTHESQLDGVQWQKY